MMHAGIRTGLMLLLTTSGVCADEIVQEGTLSGTAGDPVSHEIVLDQFDPTVGTLSFVRLDLLTSVIGGGETDGSGVAVHIFARLDADYALGRTVLAETSAIIDTVIPNDGPPTAFTVFDTDTATVTIDDMPSMAPWIGDSSLVLTGTTSFVIDEDPPGIIGFGAGGTVRYTVTYDFEPGASCPADFDDSGDIGFADLLAVLAAWGPCEACVHDLDASGDVGFADLLTVLSAWGPCV